MSSDPVGRLAGKVAVITGGGKGIGRGVALRFAAEGATVAELEEGGGRAIGLVTDVREQAAVERLVATAATDLGDIDILVTSAGIGSRQGGKFLEMTMSFWRDYIETNLTGTFVACQAVARHMVARGTHGRIITLGSINAWLTQPLPSAYSAQQGRGLDADAGDGVESGAAGYRGEYDRAGPYPSGSNGADAGHAGIRGDAGAVRGGGPDRRAGRLRVGSGISGERRLHVCHGRGAPGRRRIAGRIAEMRSNRDCRRWLPDPGAGSCRRPASLYSTDGRRTAWGILTIRELRVRVRPRSPAR
jgi:hypothetical protein